MIKIALFQFCFDIYSHFLGDKIVRKLLENVAHKIPLQMTGTSRKTLIFYTQCNSQAEFSRVSIFSHGKICLCVDEKRHKKIRVCKNTRIHVDKVWEQRTGD